MNSDREKKKRDTPEHSQSNSPTNIIEHNSDNSSNASEHTITSNNSNIPSSQNKNININESKNDYNALSNNIKINLNKKINNVPEQVTGLFHSQGNSNPSSHHDLISSSSDSSNNGMTISQKNLLEDLSSKFSIENTPNMSEKCFLITKRKKISQSQSSNSSFSNHYGCMSFYSDKGKFMFNLYRDFFNGEASYKEDEGPEDDCDSGNTVIENGIREAYEHIREANEYLKKVSKTKK